MANPTKKEHALHKRYARCAARYQKFVSAVRQNEADIRHEFCGDGKTIVCSEAFAANFTARMSGLDSICDTMIAMMTTPDEDLRLDVIKLYEGLLIPYETNYLTILEATLDTLRLYQGNGDTPENNRTFGLECLRRAERILSMMQSIKDNKHLVADKHDNDAAFRKGMVGMCAWFESYIHQTSADLAKPVFPGNRDAMRAWQQQLRAQVSKFLMQFPFSHDFVRKVLEATAEQQKAAGKKDKAEATSEKKEAALPTIAQRHMDYLKRHREFVASINSNLRAFRKHYDIKDHKKGLMTWLETNIGCMNAYVETALAELAETQVTEDQLESMEHEFLLNQEKLMPWVSIVQFRSSSMYGESDECQKLNREYCIAHLVCASELLNRIDTLCNHKNLAPATGTIEAFRTRVNELRAQVDAGVNRVYAEISRPSIAASRSDLCKWHTELMDLVLIYTQEIAGGLKYEHAAPAIALPKPDPAKAKTEKTGEPHESKEDTPKPEPVAIVIH